MEQSRLKRHAALAILMVGVVTALVAIGRILAQGGDPEEARGDEQDSWHRFSERCASDSLKTLSVAEADFRACDRDWNTPAPALEPAPIEPPPLAVAPPPAQDDFRGCGDREEVVDFWTFDVKELYTPAVPVEKPGEERR